MPARLCEFLEEPLRQHRPYRRWDTTYGEPHPGGSSEKLKQRVLQFVLAAIPNPTKMLSTYVPGNLDLRNADYFPISYCCYIGGKTVRYKFRLPTALPNMRRPEKVISLREGYSGIYMQCKLILTLKETIIKDKEQIAFLPYGWNDTPAMAFIKYKGEVLQSSPTFLIGNNATQHEYFSLFKAA